MSIQTLTTMWSITGNLTGRTVTRVVIVTACLCFWLIICPSQVHGGDAESRWPMRLRVLCDLESNVALRYPYTWRAENQYEPVLTDGRMGGMSEMEMKEVVVNGKKVMVMVPKEVKVPPIPALQVVTSTGAEAADLANFGNSHCKMKMEWKSYNYYDTTNNRVHRDPAWALDGIESIIGAGKDRCALMVRWGDRTSGVILRGSATAPVNKAILDSFEIMSLPNKPKPGSPPTSSKPPRTMTWRENRLRQGYVYDGNDKPVKAAAGKPVDWPEAWEAETEHYRILCNTSSARTLQHAAYYEALYRAYAAVYRPENLPPFKFEVHVFDRAAEFEGGARAWVDPGFSVTGGGGIIGGFFVPTLLSLWVYQESDKLGGSDFSVEKVSAHECSHQFLRVATNANDKVPTWINEGLAVYFEAGVFQNGNFLIRPPTDRISLLRSQYSSSNQTLWPLDNYIEHHGHISASQYGEVYAMTHFWVFGQGTKGLDRFRKYWQALKSGEDGAEAFENIFMKDMVVSAGSRKEAIKRWSAALVNYVKAGNLK